MKQYHRYKINFSGKFVGVSAACMGISAFMTALYYLGICNMSDFSGAELIFCLWLPLIAAVAYIVLLGAVRLNAPGIYAIMGSVICGILIFGTFFSGDVGRIFLGIPCYLLCILILIIVVGGYFPAKLPASLMFGITIGMQLVVFDIGRLSLLEWIREAQSLFACASLLFLPMCLKETKKRKKELQ